jgi:hypothetical protein
MFLSDWIKNLFYGVEGKRSNVEHSAATSEPTKIGFEGKEVYIAPTTELRRRRNQGRIGRLENSIRKRIRNGREDEEKTKSLQQELEMRKHLKAFYDLGGK